MTRSAEDKRTAGDPGGGADHSLGPSGGSGERRRLAPVLLSLLVFPGLGQFATGRPWRGLAYAGGSLVLLVGLLRRVYAETLRLMPQDPEAVLDPGLPLRLAAEIHHANAALFGWTTLGIVVLWALSGLDAWIAAQASHPRTPGSARKPAGPGRP